MRVLARKAVFRREIFSERIREKDLVGKRGDDAWTGKGVAMIPPWPRGFDESQSNEHTHINVRWRAFNFLVARIYSTVGEN